MQKQAWALKLYAKAALAFSAIFVLMPLVFAS